jgi:AcrR family transcriptional regulator
MTMARRRGVDREQVIQTALAIADRDGIDAVSLSAVAAELGIASPSLYSHVDGLGGLRRQLAIVTMLEFGERLRDAAVGRAGADAFRAMAEAYLDYGLTYPARYRLALWPTEPGDLERAEAGRRAQSAVAAVVRSFGVEADTARAAGRSFLAALHGVVDLERRREQPTAETQATFEFLVESLLLGLQSAAAVTGSGDAAA